MGIYREGGRCIGREGGRGKFAAAVAAAACLRVFVCVWLDCAEKRRGGGGAGKGRGGKEGGREGAKRGRGEGGRGGCTPATYCPGIYLRPYPTSLIDGIL